MTRKSAYECLQMHANTLKYALFRCDCFVFANRCRTPINSPRNAFEFFAGERSESSDNQMNITKSFVQRSTNQSKNEIIKIISLDVLYKTQFSNSNCVTRE